MTTRSPSPAISVIVCTYRNPAMLADTVASLVDQTLPPDRYEILVIDNNSRDETPEVTARFPTARYLFEGVQGLSAARNLGVREARAPILAFIDDDGLACREWLEELLAVYDADPDVWAAGGPAKEKWEEEPPEWLDNTFFPALSVLAWGNEPRQLFWPERVIGVNCSFRREVFDQLGMFDELLGRNGSLLLGCEDTEIQKRIHNVGRKVWYNPKALVLHRIPASRMNREVLRARSLGSKMTFKLLDIMASAGREEAARFHEELLALARAKEATDIVFEDSAKFWSSGRREEAMRLMKELAAPKADLANLPWLSRALSILGEWHEELGLIVDALVYAARVVLLDTNDQTSLVRFATLAAKVGEKEEAARVLDKFLSRITIGTLARRCREGLDMITGEPGWPTREDVRALFGARLAKLKGVGIGRRCVLVGNGPSVARTDLSLFGDAAIMGLNKNLVQESASGYEVDFDLSIAPLFLEVTARGLERFPGLGGEEGGILLAALKGDDFSRNPADGISIDTPITVSALQLLYHMGFEEVVLVGVDHNYPPEMQRQMALFERSYQKCREAFEADGRRILDATVGGRLTVFPKFAHEDA